MPIKLKAFILFSLVFGTTALAAPEQVLERLNLAVGSVRALKRPNGSDVQVSRRGIVDVSLQDNEEVRLIAMRQGLVVLTFIGADGATLSKMLVNVSAATATGSSKPRTIDRSYVVRMRLVAVDTSTDQDVGLEPLLVDNNSALVPHAALRKRNAEVLSEPVLVVREGYLVEVLSGGEFKVSINANDDRDYERAAWKKFGVSFKLRVDRLTAAKVKLTAKLESSDQSGSDQSRLQIGALDSELITCLSCVKLIGTIDVKTSAAGINSWPWLPHIPIIGPLLQRRQSSEGMSKLLVWAYVEEDGADNTAALRAVAWPDLKTVF